MFYHSDFNGQCWNLILLRNSRTDFVREESCDHWQMEVISDLPRASIDDVPSVELRTSKSERIHCLFAHSFQVHIIESYFFHWTHNLTEKSKMKNEVCPTNLSRTGSNVRFPKISVSCPDVRILCFFRSLFD